VLQDTILVVVPLATSESSGWPPELKFVGYTQFFSKNPHGKTDTKKREFPFPDVKRISMFKAVIWQPAFYPTVN
jgi:hypothetical protein